MAGLNLNFASPGMRSWATAAVLLLAVLGCMHSLWQREQLLSQIEAGQQRLAALDRGTPRRESGSAESRRNSDAEAAARLLSAELQRPWEEVLDAVQVAVRPDLVITRLQPDAQGHRLAVSGVAENSAAFLAFAQRLKGQGRWGAVEPVSLGRGGEAASGAGVPLLDFELTLEWRPE